MLMALGLTPPTAVALDLTPPSAVSPVCVSMPPPITSPRPRAAPPADVPALWQRRWREVGGVCVPDPRAILCMVAVDAGVGTHTYTRTVTVWQPVAEGEEACVCAACGLPSSVPPGVSVCACRPPARAVCVRLEGEWADTPLLPGDMAHIVPLEELGALMCGVLCGTTMLNIVDLDLCVSCACAPM